jgi:hypothetical protein
MATGLAFGVAGLLWFTQVGVHTGYLVHVLPAELVTSFGIGMVFVPLSSTALIGVNQRDAGVASALLNTTQQVGSSLGIALLNTLAASATATYLTAHGHSASSLAAGLVHGYTTGFTVSAAILALAFLVTVGLIRGTRATRREVAPAGVPDGVPASISELQVAASRV